RLRQPMAIGMEEIRCIWIRFEWWLAHADEALRLGDKTLPLQPKMPAPRMSIGPRRFTLRAKVPRPGRWEGKHLAPGERTLSRSDDLAPKAYLGRAAATACPPGRLKSRPRTPAWPGRRARSPGRRRGGRRPRCTSCARGSAAGARGGPGAGD